jgi:bacterial/archaeal transporter family protein
MPIPRWLLYALLSAFSAAFVGIFAKIGMPKGVNTNLATAVRGVVMAVLLCAFAAALRLWPEVTSIPRKAFVGIVLSGAAGAVSWLFYFRAIQLGHVSQVAPIDKLSMPLAAVLAVLILGDRPHWFNWVGILLIVAGGYLASR